MKLKAAIYFSVSLKGFVEKYLYRANKTNDYGINSHVVF